MTPPDPPQDTAGDDKPMLAREGSGPAEASEFRVIEEGLNDASWTAAAPSFTRPVSPVSPVGGEASREMEVVAVGSRIDDFQIEAILGRGAFGIVYLARQMSLNRQVALKISHNQGSEGRTMAQLEHENIVQVFSESLSHDGSRRLLCMQYIHGATLEAIIQHMHGTTSRRWGGGSILQLIDGLNPDPPPFHPAALRERQELEHTDSLEAVCWIGERLAEALAYAHQKGVLHRDIKPANILQTRYGRPMLADFNLAFQPIDVRHVGGSLFGGTLAYMSPEHLDAFHPNRATEAAAVDEGSDLFSLGVVLYELASGNVGLKPADKALDNLAKLEQISEQRQQLPPAIGKLSATSQRVFDRTIRKCLQPDSKRRYCDAAELASGLAGCRMLSQAERDLPRAGPITRSALRRPFLWLVMLAILPHLPIGSTVNIAYNALCIVSRLSPAQQTAFRDLIPIYNGIVYPICFGFLFYLLRPVYRVWNRLQHESISLDPQEVATARQLSTRWPLWVVILACLGWMPGAVFFPLALHMRAGPVAPWVFGHFLISCTLSGLIAMTYSYFAIQYLATRIFYTNLWTEVHALRATAERELKGLKPNLRYFQKMAGLVPLAGAVLVVAQGPEDASVVGTYEFLVITLIVLGFCGFELANKSTLAINQTVDALTMERGSSRPGS